MPTTENGATTMGRPISVLVVDDNMDHRFLIDRRLSEAGLDVRTAGTGEDALEALDVDLVLLDYKLPGMSGIDTLGEIRRRGGPSVVMVTGMGSEGTAVEAMRSGAIDYVVKNPGYLDALPNIVERAFRQHDLARRAGELQRIALVVSSATEREETLVEIVRGAHRLLDADACALYVFGPDGLRLEAREGDTTHDVERLLTETRDFLSDDADQIAHDDRLYVALPSAEGERLGVLALLSDVPRTYLPGDVDLARTFASFAGIALGKLQQLELERALVVELQRMLDLRRDVVASVSHELRTPLTCITGFAHTLIDHWTPLPDEDRIDFVNKIRDHAMELEDLVDRLFHFASFETGRIEAETRPVELHTAVTEAAAALDPLTSQRDLSLDVPELVVLADPTLLRRTLSNLLSNSIKYSDADSRITIRATEDGDAVRVAVTDEGIGMTPDEAGRAFEPFWRARRVAAAAIRGAGIGLALVKEYVRVMEGEVGVRSEPGRGSTFWFTLPRHPPGAETHQA